MKNLAIYTSVLVAACIAIAHADNQIHFSQPKRLDSVPTGRYAMVYRQARDTYAIPGAGVIHTLACTQSANGEMSVRVGASYNGKPWIYFYDRDGRLENDCQMVGGK